MTTSTLSRTTHLLALFALVAFPALASQYADEPAEISADALGAHVRMAGGQPYLPMSDLVSALRGTVRHQGRDFDIRPGGGGLLELNPGAPAGQRRTAKKPTLSVADHLVSKSLIQIGGSQYLPLEDLAAAMGRKANQRRGKWILVQRPGRSNPLLILSQRAIAQLVPSAEATAAQSPAIQRDLRRPVPAPQQPQAGSTEGSKQLKVLPAGPPLRAVVKPSLEVERLGKEFVDRGTEIVVNEPRTLELYWTNPRSQSKGAEWQLSDSDFGPRRRRGAAWATGNTGDCPAGGKCYFKVNLAQTGIVPLTPPGATRNFYLRVLLAEETEDGGASNSVHIEYKKSTQAPTKFTTKGLMPELWQPMTIEVKLDTLSIPDADEPRDEEPYLLVATIWADGTTIDPLNFATSHVRLDASAGAHGNVPPMIYYQGSVAIPASTGTFRRQILPIGLNALELAESFGKTVDVDTLTKNTLIAIVVVAMEEDATSDDTANAARRAMISGLRDGLNQIIQSMTLTQVQSPGFANDLMSRMTALGDQVLDKVKDAAVASTLGDLWWLPGMILTKLGEIADPDDFIGANVAIFRYEDFRKSNAVRIDLPLQGGSDSARYRVTGWARRR